MNQKRGPQKHNKNTPKKKCEMGLGFLKRDSAYFGYGDNATAVGLAISHWAGFQMVVAAEGGGEGVAALAAAQSHFPPFHPSSLSQRLGRNVRLMAPSHEALVIEAR